MNYMYIVCRVLLLYITGKHLLCQIISEKMQFNSIQTIGHIEVQFHHIAQMTVLIRASIDGVGNHTSEISTFSPVGLHVSNQMAGCSERFFTNTALMRLLSCVNSHVLGQIVGYRERLLTNTALMRLLTGVNFHVAEQVAGLIE